MVNFLPPALPMSRVVDSIMSPLPSIPLLDLVLLRKSAFRKLSEFKRNSIWIQKAICIHFEAKRLTESIPTTVGSQTEANLNSESFLLSFAA